MSLDLKFENSLNILKKEAKKRGINDYFVRVNFWQDNDYEIELRHAKKEWIDVFFYKKSLGIYIYFEEQKLKERYRKIRGIESI